MIESRSLRASASCLRCESFSFMASASLTMFSTSASDRPPLLLITTLCSLPVPLSLAITLTMPSALMSKVTSIWGTPRGAGGTPTSSKLPSFLLSAAISRSPWRTVMPTWVWLSAAVEKVWLLLVGMVVLRGMSLVITPPSVSMPRDSGVTSRRMTSVTSPWRTPPWMAAPMATTSSGLTPLEGFFLKVCSTTSATWGMRVMPPTRRTSSTCPASTSASLRHLTQGSLERSRRGMTMFS
mmetsp:Transcript_108579/g.151735  ORF Transcript_108579/g.151735 Transcript_108579/m.151735 type:complete len:239 (-) Transcript_108579:315-1031(-)